jgi:hypothetical protein
VQKLTNVDQYKAFVLEGEYEKFPKVVGKIARITAEFILDYLEKMKVDL